MNRTYSVELESAEMIDGRRRNRVLRWKVFIVLVFEACSVATGLNADGIALRKFKEGITSDPQRILQNWNGSDATPCNWTGIGCRTIQGLQESRVVEIMLPRHALGGTISGSLAELAYLETVNLDTNKLTGEIPREINVTSLYLSNNMLTGEIPAMGNKLRVMELSSNKLTGLPKDLVNCHQLQRLVLHNNNVTGLLPNVSNWAQLERLDLSVNHFYGTIPDDFGNLTTLQETLNLSSNHLSGSIPQSLAILQKIFIDFSNNNLSGPIPSDSYFQSLGVPAFTGNAALCGSPLKTECAPATATADSGLRKGVVIGIAVGCGVGGTLIMAALIFYFCLRKLSLAKKTLRNDSGLRGCLCSWRESVSGFVSGDGEDDGELVHLSGVFSFSLDELLRASAYVLGKSGVGIVYKAVLDEGTVVAVRRLGSGSEQKQKEFEAAVKSIAQVRHPNIVSLHSFSCTTDEKLLIYDYLANGSLDMALHGRSERSKGFLTWEARLRIARGVAQGIAHIHECSSKNYIHGDIKPGNILLDGFMEARVADFGLQRLLALADPEPLKEFGSTRGDPGIRQSDGSRWKSPSPVRGDRPFVMGVYQAPEAMTAKKPTQKSDVYSFGVVLLELLTGRSPFQQLSAGELDLVSWMRASLQEKKALTEIFDPCLLKGNTQESKLIETLQVALACISISPDSRPKMKQVAELFELLASS